jgi:hypothetical protein
MNSAKQLFVKGRIHGLAGSLRWQIVSITDARYNNLEMKKSKYWSVPRIMKYSICCIPKNPAYTDERWSHRL